MTDTGRDGAARARADAVLDALRRAPNEVRHEHTREVVRFDEEGMRSIADAIDALKARVAALESPSTAIALQSEPAPQITTTVVPEDVAVRLEALEQHAHRSGGLVEALKAIIAFAQERDERIARLEEEATQTHSAVAKITPMLLAMSARRAS